VWCLLGNIAWQYCLAILLGNQFGNKHTAVVNKQAVKSRATFG
jgi:hypothetical protein